MPPPAAVRGDVALGREAAPDGVEPLAGLAPETTQDRASALGRDQAAVAHRHEQERSRGVEHVLPPQPTHTAQILFGGVDVEPPPGAADGGHAVGEAQQPLAAEVLDLDEQAGPGL